MFNLGWPVPWTSGARNKGNLGSPIEMGFQHPLLRPRGSNRQTSPTVGSGRVSSWTSGGKGNSRVLRWGNEAEERTQQNWAMSEAAVCLVPCTSQSNATSSSDDLLSKQISLKVKLHNVSCCTMRCMQLLTRYQSLFAGFPVKRLVFRLNIAKYWRFIHYNVAYTWLFIYL